MSALLSDVRYGFRMLVKNPGFLFVAVLTLALGIGANTAIFSIVNAVLLRPLPYPDPDRLVTLWEAQVSDYGPNGIASAPNFHDWEKQNDVFEQMAMFDSAGRGYDLSSTGMEAERVSGDRVSSNFFSVLGVRPYIGRIFLPEEEQPGKDHVVILSHQLWTRRYGADPAIVGRTIKVDEEDYTVVGVMPRDFEFQFWSGPRQLWVPVGYTEGDRERDSHSFLVLARLKSNVTFERARAEMDTIGRRLAKEYPDDNAGKTVAVVTASEIATGGLRQSLLALLAAVGFVLLIACANVANLLLARGAVRQKEMAVRRALGAGRGRIARQLVTESLLLSMLGGFAGVLLAWWGTTFLSKFVPRSLRFVALRPLDTITMDGHVVAFAFVVSCLTGVLFGLAPAVATFHGDVNDALKEGTRGSTQQGGNRLRHALVAAEVALALIVLAGAGLMMKSMVRLLGVDPGFDPKNVLTMTMTLPQVNIYYGPPVHARFCEDLQERVGAIAGVESVSASAHLPMSGGAGRGFVIEGRPDSGPENQPGAGYSVVCPAYLHTMGIPILEGREFDQRDTLSSPGVIVINQSMALRNWPNEDPLGKRIKLGLFNSSAPWLTIVGVYRDVHHWGLDEKPTPEFLRPYTQAAWPTMTIVAHTISAPGSFAAPIRKALSEIEPDRAASPPQTLEAIVSASLGSRRFPMMLLAGFALLALVLAAVGIAGVVAYSVVQRTHEIGIRMALGAQSWDVLRLVVSRSMLWTLAGVVIGLAGAVGLTRVLVKLLYGVTPTDPLVLGGVSLVLFLVSLLASYVPARRATAVDPLVALRWE